MNRLPHTDDLRPRIGTHFAVVLTAAASIAAVGCSLVEFERSPYAPRDVDVVYSAQEDITFFVWRVEDEVDFDRVDFEILDGGSYDTVDLADVPFPSEPYECEPEHYCVQYQRPGRWTDEQVPVPIRAIDERHGTFESTPTRFHHVDETFSIEPLAVDNNVAAKARLDDWFARNGIPLRRSFQWALIDRSTSDTDDCPTDPIDQWDRLENRVDLPQGWRESTPCFAVRPDRRDRPGTEIRRPLIKAPMLFADDIERLIPEIKHPTLVAFLVDLEIASDQRCEDAVQSIRQTIFDELDERDTAYVDLGIHRPIAFGQAEYSGCDQSDSARYPVDDILIAADEEAAHFERPTTLVVVYLNNLELEPSMDKMIDLQPLFGPPEPGFAQPDGDPHIFTWSIGANTINFLFPWQHTSPWSALEDENFLPSIENTTSHYFPLRSADFGLGDSISLPAPEASDSPKSFRLCTFSPDPHSVRIPPSSPLTYSGDTWPWPGQGQPELYFPIEPQNFVAYDAFRETRVTGIYEVCTMHCENPFLSTDGNIYPSWRDTEGVCRWQ